VLKAALGKVKITPEERVPLQGYNPETHVADPKKDVLDDLYARVLLLEREGQRKAVVSVDCCLTNEQAVRVADPGGREGQYREFAATFPQGTREGWARAAGTDPQGLAVCATHTHTAPASFGAKDTARIEGLIRRLAGRLEPVRLYAAEGRSGVSAFRRPTLRADLSVPVNQTLKALVLETPEGEPLGAVVNYAVHPTAVRNPASRISGDLVGLAVSEVERRMGGSFTALFLQGFSGDICPRYGDNGRTGDTYAEVVEGGRVLAGDILEALKRRTEVPVTRLRSLSRTAAFPTRTGFGRPAMDVTLFGLSLGDALLLTVSGEVFNEYIAKAEALSPARHTLLAGLSNGYSGYLPTRHAFHDGLGGYEMRTTPYTDEVEERLLGEIRSLIRALE